MSIDLIDMLNMHLHDREMGAVIKEALQFIGTAPYRSQHLSSNTQSSNAVAKLYKFRKEKRHISQNTRGLDETISSLSAQEVSVRFGFIETDKYLIAIWLTEDKSLPVGIMIFKRISQDA